MATDAGSSQFRNYDAKKDESTSRDIDGEKTIYHKNLIQRMKSSMRNFKFFGVELSPDNFAVAIVYFVQGVLGLSRLAVSFYMKDDLHLDPAEVFASYN